MIGESSSRRSYASFSATNLVGGEDYSSFGTDDVDVEMYRDVMFSPPNFDELFPNFDDCLQQIDAGGNEQLENESNGGAFEVVQRSDSPKKWKHLLSRVFSFKKRGSLVLVDVAPHPHHKKHKIG